MVMEKLGAFVRKERKARKINLREMAMMIRVAPIRLSKVERDMSRPTENEVYKIAYIIKCDPDLLLARAGRLSSQVKEIINRYRVERAQLIRTSDPLTPEDLVKLTLFAKEKAEAEKK